MVTKQIKEIPFYNRRLTIFIFDTRKELIEILKKYKIQHNGIANGLTCCNDIEIMVFIKSDKPYAIAHECCHIVFDTFSIIGQKIDNESSNEPFCYLVEYLYKIVYKLFEKHNSSKK